ncbi:MAG: pyridoxal 5'-phosphate synthase glutaminase subunit PdxT [Actinomycetota bacterium]
MSDASAPAPADAERPGTRGRPRIGVLALQGAFARHIEMLQGCGATTVEIRQPEHLEGIDAVVIPGGESTTMVKLLETFELAKPLQELIDGGLPLLGTCAGMILAADRIADGYPGQLSFGAIDLDVRRNGYGRQVDSFEADLVVPELGADPMRAVFIRAPVVERAGPEVDVLATVEGHPVLCRQGRVLVTSFHPELTADDRLHRLFIGMVPT